LTDEAACCLNLILDTGRAVFFKEAPEHLEQFEKLKFV
jgi:hypothetical protein